MTTPTPSSTVIIRPQRGWAALNLRDLWAYRELVYFLTWRDIKVRYKQAALGVAWAVLQPLLTMVIFTIIFGRLAGLSSEGFPYAVFTYAALLPWTLFASALQRSSTSLVTSANLLTKVYFPRLAIPLAAVGAGLVDFLISSAVLMGLMAYYHIPFTWNLLVLPGLVALALLTALAVGLWLAALNVQYRDVQQMTPFLIVAWQYASPVAYSALIIPERWRLLYGLNPMVGIIQGFRWAILGGEPPDRLLAVSIAVVLIVLVSGLFYFRKMEKTFADTV